MSKNTNTEIIDVDETVVEEKVSFRDKIKNKLADPEQKLQLVGKTIAVVAGVAVTAVVAVVLIGLSADETDSEATAEDEMNDEVSEA